MNKIIKNENGYLLLNVIFLTLITSLAAMILINAAPRIKNPHASLRLTALYLANEQFAYLESQAATNDEPLNTDFQGEPEDLTTCNAGVPVTFTVETQINDNSNPRRVTVKVTWTFNEENFELKSERMIWIAH